METADQVDLLTRTLDMVDAALARPPTRDELIAAQKALCERKGYPHFAPRSGYCTHCKADIVTSEWAAALISGCKACRRSYCD